MYNEHTILIERQGEWFVARCLDLPDARGRGRTKEECLADVICAIGEVLAEKRRKDPPGLPEPSPN